MHLNNQGEHIMLIREEIKKAIFSTLKYFGHIKIETTFNSLPVITFITYQEDIQKIFWARLVYELNVIGIIKGIFKVPCVELDKGLYAIWVNNIPIICQNNHAKKHRYFSLSMPADPPNATFIAIGGPSGAGKSTVIKKLKNHFKARVYDSVTYTTRPPRAGEIDGIDYNFADKTEIIKYQNDPRYIHFIKARGNWYWNDSTEVIEAAWKTTDGIYLTAITQVQEFLDRKLIYPELHWIWLTASNDELISRLKERGDDDIEKSREHNYFLDRQDRSKLISLEINTKGVEPETTLEQITYFMKKNYGGTL